MSIFLNNWLRGRMMSAPRGGGGDDVVIPSVYQRVEWLESTTRGPYIQLPFGFDKTDKIILTSAVEVISDAYVLSPSVWNSSGSNRFALGGSVYNSFTCAFGNKSTTDTYLQPRTSADEYIHTWEYDNYIFSSPDLNISLQVDPLWFDIETSDLRLFYGYLSAYRATVKELKYWKGGQLVAHLIPCYRKSDGKPGMWDVVGWKFYENAGSGADFTVGPDVVEPATKYIVFEDRAVEAICVANWSSDGIGLTMQDAAAVTSLGQKFRENTQITSFDELQYFTGVTTLSEDFFRCINLNRLMLPKNLTSFGVYEFYNVPITELTFPETLTSCGFTANTGLRVISLPTSPPTINDYWGSMSSFTYYVPYSADHSILDAYKAASGWSTYASQIYELNPDGTIPT